MSKTDATTLFKELPQSIAARSSIGKTSLSLNIIENLLLNEDVPVALFSLEMSGVQLAERLMCSLGRTIKSLAKELDIPVILLSRLNRASANMTNFMPRLTDMRESGSIEQDADVVLLHREDYYHKGQADYCNTNVADVIIARLPNNPIGSIILTFRPELSRFECYTITDALVI
jgi:replicative DNA helicase